MKKRKTNKKLPRYDLGTVKRLPLGYQPAKGIGDATFESQPGQSIEPETRALRANRFANAVGQAQQSFQYPMQILQDTAKTGVSATTSSVAPTLSTSLIKAATSTAVPSLTTTIPAALPAAGIGSGGILGSSMSGSLLSQGTSAGSKVGSLAAQNASEFFGTSGGTTSSASSASSGALGTLGIVAGGVGTALGGLTMANQISNAGSHRTASDMQNTVTRNIYTTAGGNQYEELGGPDAGAELGYENEMRKQKQIGFGINAIGTGMSLGGVLGSVIPGFGNLAGLGIGAGLGALIGGLASLFGFGDNEEEVREEMRKLADANARYSAQNEAVAKSKDYETNRAANGKKPVWTPAGLAAKKATARVSNGEVVGNFNTGKAIRVPGQKNNKDTKLANLKDDDFVISNRFGLSDYAAATGDYEGALNMQEILLGNMRNSKGYKCGKLPKYGLGTIADYALATLPHFGSVMTNLAQYNRAKYADTYAPDTFVEDSLGRAAVNELNNLRYDVTPYLRDAQKALNMQNWNVRRNVGLGLGGRAVAQNANFQAYLNSLANIYNAKNDAENKFIAMRSDAKAKLGAATTDRLTNSMVRKFGWQQQQNAAKENWMAQYLQNRDMGLLNMAADYLRMNQYKKAQDIENKKIGLWEQQNNIDGKKVDAMIQNMSTPVLASTSNSPYVPITLLKGIGNRYQLQSPDIYNLLDPRWNISRS